MNTQTRQSIENVSDMKSRAINTMMKSDGPVKVVSPHAMGAFPTQENFGVSKIEINEKADAQSMKQMPDKEASDYPRMQSGEYHHSNAVPESNLEDPKLVYNTDLKEV